MGELRAFVSALACAALVASASAAHAQPAPGSREQAKRLFEEGVDLEKKADYVAALSKYREAEQITATAGLRFHEGYCHEMTGKLAAALEDYELADKMAREQNKQDVHAAVIARLEPLRARVPQIVVRLTTPVKDAEVQLDGAPVATKLLDGTAFRIDPGEHVVSARAGGYKPLSRKVPVPEGITTTVDLFLEPLSSAAPAGAAASGGGQVTEPPPEPPRGRSLALPLATTAGAVVLAGAGVAMFLVAGSKQSDAQRDCAQKTSCDRERSSVRRFDALALGGFIGAAGLAVVSVILFTSSGPRVTAGPGAVRFEGTFW